MRYHLGWPMVIVAVLAAGSFGTAAWGLYDLARAHDCLNNGNYSASITERGCELVADHGSILIELNGPGFGLTLVATAAWVLLVGTFAVLAVVRRRLFR